MILFFLCIQHRILLSMMEQPNLRHLDRKYSNSRFFPAFRLWALSHHLLSSNFFYFFYFPQISLKILPIRPSNLYERKSISVAIFLFSFEISISLKWILSSNRFLNSITLLNKKSSKYPIRCECLNKSFLIYLISALACSFDYHWSDIFLSYFNRY